jgi:hypothetical protein
MKDSVSESLKTRGAIVLLRDYLRRVALEGGFIYYESQATN